MVTLVFMVSPNTMIEISLYRYQEQRIKKPFFEKKYVHYLKRRYRTSLMKWLAVGYGIQKKSDRSRFRSRCQKQFRIVRLQMQPQALQGAGVYVNSAAGAQP